LGRRFRMRTVNQNERQVEKQIAEIFAGKLVKHSLTFTPLQAIPVAEIPKETTPKTLAPPPDAFAGGFESVLDLKTQNEAAEVAPNTIKRYLVDELRKAQVEEPENLLLVEGMAGSGTTAAEGKVKLFHTLKLKSQKAIPKDKLSAALVGVQSFMEQKPLFDEVTTFSTSVADETKTWAAVAILMSLVAIVIYIWFRFENVNYGIGAVVALTHDVLFALGCLAMGSYLSNTPIGPLLLLNDFKINMAIVAAFLTIVGYSLNDTIVIFDRLRELKGKAPVVTRDMFNLAVNQTLSRTILTTLTVLLTVFILYILGGEGIHGFAFTMLTGCLAGTYSTIFIANPVVLWLTERTSSANRNLPRQIKPAPAVARP